MIPSRRLLAHILPRKYPSSSCTFCSDVEDIFHMFFRCPPTFVFWDHLIREYLWPGHTIDRIFEALSSLNFSSIRVLPSCPLSAPLLLTVALAEIWKSHWLHIIQGIPFSALCVLRNLRIAVTRRHSEDIFVND